MILRQYLHFLVGAVNLALFSFLFGYLSFHCQREQCHGVLSLPLLEVLAWDDDTLELEDHKTSNIEHLSLLLGC